MKNVSLMDSRDAELVQIILSGVALTTTDNHLISGANAASITPFARRQTAAKAVATSTTCKTLNQGNRRRPS